VGGGERREETGMTRFLWMPRSGPADSNRDYGCDSAALSLSHGCLFLIRTLYMYIHSIDMLPDGVGSQSLL
jgi:hypothetical protein